VKSLIRLAVMEELDEIKNLIQSNMKDIGYFINKGIISEAIKSNRMLICVDDKIVGICIFNIRKKDSKFVIYDIITNKESRGKGYGKEMIDYIKNTYSNDIYLKCPTDSDSNIFYKKCNFELIKVEPGKHRQLNVWIFYNNGQVRL